jgi:hypothetical protein
MAKKYVSNYDKMIARMKKEGKIRTSTPEEMKRFAQDMNKGMEEFCWEQKRQQHYAFNQLANIVLM